MALKNRYKGKGLLILSFSTLYALSVLILSILFRFFPSAIVLENQFFDRIQSDIAIDSKSDYLYKRYQQSIDELFLINLDPSFFNFETNRLKREKLAKLFSKINESNTKAELIFFDYAYSEQAQDTSQLKTALDALQTPIVFPINFEINGDIRIEGEESRLTKDRLARIHEPAYPAQHIGYAVPFKDPYSNSHRYFKYILDDQSYSSVPYQMFHLSKHRDQSLILDPYAMNEVHFILRNREVIGKERASLLYDASDILDGTMPLSYLQDNLQNKVVVIGLFEDYKTKYLNPIDKFITPVDGSMSGALLITNAYLNLANNIYFSKNNWLILFIINFLAAVIICLNYEHGISSRYKSLITLFFSLIISVIIFYYLAYWFYLLLGFKLSLGMSLLIYQKKYYLYTWYQHRWKERNT